MKKTYYTLAIVAASAILSNAFAQTTKTPAIMTEPPVQVTGPTPKAQFINNQEYLNAASAIGSRSLGGDSLLGFQEDKVKVELLGNYFYGMEYIYMMKQRKREFVNNKYRIGPNYGIKNVPSPQPGGGPGKSLGGGNNVINVAPCVNEDFELCSVGSIIGSNSLAVQGWTVQWQNNNGSNGSCNTNTNLAWTAGTPEGWIMATPIFGVPYIGTIPNSPLGGSKVIKLGDDINGYTYIHRLSQTFPVTNANTLFQFAYAGSWDGSGHACCDQPFFRIQMYDCNMDPLSCASLSLTPAGPNCPGGAPGYSVSSPGGVSYCNWTTKYIDLTPFIGTCVTIRFVSGDCDASGHAGSIYLDTRCGGQLVGAGLAGIGGNIPGPVSFCAGSNMAMISAPLGYNTYSWVAPPGSPVISAANATLANLVINGPVSNAVYTVYLTSPSGCQFVATNTIITTQVNIAGLGSTSTCPGGASGSATVQGNGSGTGYNYTWTNLSNSVVGTQSVVNNLGPGVYNIMITGLGAQGCGSAAATVTVGTAPQSTIGYLKPYCNGQAYLSTAGGTNFQWYNGLSAISASLGGTAASYTVNSPSNGAIYWLSYLSNQNCQDSIQFILMASPPGAMAVTYNKLVCPNANNGVAVITITPAVGSPPGVNSYVVANLPLTPAYLSTLFPTASYNYTASNLSAAGNYTVNGFDGSCLYQTTFQVPVLNWDFTMTPQSSTLCPGNQIAAGVTFTSPPNIGQYSYSWTPTTWLAGGIGNFQNTIITPVVPMGTNVNIIYSITVIPAAAYCPSTKTMQVLGVNPPTPTIGLIPPQCNTFPPFNINYTPPGGTFVTGISGTNNPVSPLGVLTPSLGVVGPASLALNVYTYAINVYQCVAQNTFAFELSTFYTAALTNSVPPLCTTSSPFNLMTIVANTVTGQWVGQGTNGNNQFVPATLQQLQPLITQPYTIYYNTYSQPNPQTCPMTSSLSVTVTKTITPAINPAPQICSNATAINMTVSPGGGTWYGNSAVSSGGVLTPSNNTSGYSSTVFYSVVIGPCINTATSTLLIPTFNSANFTGTVNNLCVTSNPVNLLNIVQNTVGTWVGTSVSNNAFSPANLATNIYTLTYNTQSTPATTLCPDTRTLAVSVLNPPVPVITQVGPYCSKGAPIQMSVTPNTGAWTGASYLTNTGLFTSSLAAVGNNAIQYVIGTPTCNSQQTKFVSVEAFVPATIMTTIPDQCNTNAAINLLPITQSNLGTWNGPGMTGTNFNPAVTGSGNFVLMYNTASYPSGLCPDQGTVAVAVYSLAPPIVTKIGPYCNSAAPVQLQVSPVGGLFGGANNTAVSLKGLFNPGAAVVGNNVINYSITSGPCVAYAQTIVQIEKFISADYEKYAGPYCKYNDAVNMNSFVQNTGGTWSGPGLVGSMFHPSKANMGNGNIIIYHTHSMPTATLCPDTSAVRIQVNDVPNVSILGNLNSGCSPLLIELNTPNANTGKGEWNFGDGSEVKTGLSTNHVFTAPGTYTVTFSYKDEIGCVPKEGTSLPVTVFENPEANFSAPEEILISNPDIQLTNLTTVLGNNKYLWKIPSVYEGTDVNPKVEFPHIGKYYVTLQAESSQGCKDEITKVLEVKNDFNIYIPTSFSPNEDNLNDVFVPVFSPYGLDIKSYEMEIFDRWGHSLFRTKDVTKGWDGMNKGESLKEEVYIYRIKYKDLDGNAYSKMGHVSLVK